MVKKIYLYFFFPIILFFTNLFFGFILFYQERERDFLLLFFFLFFVFLNILINLFSFSFLFKEKKKKILNINDVLNKLTSRFFEIFDFGILFLDEKNNIIWLNQFLEKKNFNNYLGKNINDLHKNLNAIENNKDHFSKLKINDYFFEINYFFELKVLILNDITKHQILLNKYKNEVNVIGVLAIDNIQYGLQMLSDEKIIIFENQIKNKLNDFSETYEALVIGNIKNGYNIIFNYKNFLIFQEEMLDFLKDFKEIGNQYNINISLSGGFAYGSPFIKDLYFLAFNNKSLAIKSGGDQIIIKNYNGKTFFINSRTNLERKNIQKDVIFFSYQLIKEIEAAEKILIMGHKNADYDSLASALAIVKICESLSKESKIIVDLNLIEQKTINFLFKTLTKSYIDNIFINPLKSLSLLNKKKNNKILLIIVDTHSLDNLESQDVLNFIEKIIIIDHHRFLSKKAISHPSPLIRFVNHYSSSTSEIIAEIIRHHNHKLKIKNYFIWNWLLAGIIIDTFNFQNTQTTKKTFEICGFLKELGADFNFVQRHLKEDFGYVIQKFKNIENYYQFKKNIFIVIMNGNSHVVDLAKTANVFLEMNSNLIAVFVIGFNVEGLVCVSARSIKNFNVQKICEFLGGGGSLNLAAVQSNETNIKIFEKKLLEVLEKNK